ncbi:MAG: hypothetical protein ACTSPW_17960 [Promethearchaeota archaeon]
MDITFEDKYREKRIFRLSIYLCMIITFILTFIEIWQLIIIPGIIVGILNKDMKRGATSGALGILIVWIIYTIVLMVMKNIYTLLDQFAGLIFGSLGYGWLILIVIWLLGALFGALGGSIGGGIAILWNTKNKKNKNKDIKKPVKNKKLKEN